VTDADDATDEAGDSSDTNGATVDDTTTDDTTTDEAAVLDELFAVIEERRDALPEGSYTASLFTHQKGENGVLEKIGEEAIEVVLAAKEGNDEELVGEAADLVYHLLVLLAMKGLGLADLRAELRERR
jgi:phosphoribosyl-ATP pyrophosphohydrolase